MAKDLDVNIFSVQDILDTYKTYCKENSPEACEPILYFVSELTGMSVDAILENI